MGRHGVLRCRFFYVWDLFSSYLINKCSNLAGPVGWGGCWRRMTRGRMGIFRGGLINQWGALSIQFIISVQSSHHVKKREHTKYHTSTVHSCFVDIIQTEHEAIGTPAAILYRMNKEYSVKRVLVSYVGESIGYCRPTRPRVLLSVNTQKQPPGRRGAARGGCLFLFFLLSKNIIRTLPMGIPPQQQSDAW